MGFGNMINLALRGVQFLCTLIVMALVGNMIAEAFAGNPSIINYDMFVAVFSMLSLLYLIPVAIKDSFAMHPLIPLILDVLNTLFFLCGGIAMAAILRVHSCGSRGYLRSNSITNGSRNMGKRCHEGQATTAFLWFAFAAYLASAVISGLGSRNSGTTLRSGGIRRGGPSMSQV